MKKKLFGNKSLVKSIEKMKGGDDPMKLEIGMVWVSGKP